MKKLLILFMIAALMGCLSVSAQNPYRCDTIALGETKVITVPAPDGEIDEGTVYFQQEFTFTAEESGTYRMIMSYEDDPKNPYDVFLDVPGSYLELEKGIEFEATAGETCQISFQYPTHDGRYPEITFSLEASGVETNPKTSDLYFLLPLFCLILSAGLLVVFQKQYHA